MITYSQSLFSLRSYKFISECFIRFEWTHKFRRSRITAYISGTLYECKSFLMPFKASFLHPNPREIVYSKMPFKRHVNEKLAIALFERLAWKPLGNDFRVEKQETPCVVVTSSKRRRKDKELIVSIHLISAVSINLNSWGFSHLSHLLMRSADNEWLKQRYDTKLLCKRYLKKINTSSSWWKITWFQWVNFSLARGEA